MSHSLLFLGTSAGVPTRRRNVSATALVGQNAKAWTLFDCGEGTQHRVLASRLSIYHLERVFITHLHGDHFYGLFGLLASRAMSGAVTPLHLFGPKGSKEAVSTLLRLSHSRLPYALKIEEIGPGFEANWPDFRIRALSMAHTVPTLGFVIDFPARPGRLDVQKAKALGIEPGPVYGRLKRAERVRLSDGRVIDGKSLLGPPLPGKRLAIGGDNQNPMLFAPYAPFDVMVHEATYLGGAKERMLAKTYGHSTAKELGQSAKAMGVKRLILTHISARYDSVEGTEALRKAAALPFGGEVTVAEDGLEIVL